jgi:hypothetical protein
MVTEFNPSLSILGEINDVLNKPGRSSEPVKQRLKVGERLNVRREHVRSDIRHG